MKALILVLIICLNLFGAEVRSYKGKISRVEKYQHHSETWLRAHIDIGSKTLLFDLGPAWYLERNDIYLKAFDEAKVRSLRPNDSKQSLVVLQLSIGEKKLELRNLEGVPLWKKD